MIHGVSQSWPRARTSTVGSALHCTSSTTQAPWVLVEVTETPRRPAMTSPPMLSRPTNTRPPATTPPVATAAVRDDSSVDGIGWR